MNISKNVSIFVFNVFVLHYKLQEKFTPKNKMFMFNFPSLVFKYY